MSMLGPLCGIILFVGILMFPTGETVVLQFLDCNNDVLFYYRATNSCLSLPEWKVGQVCEVEMLGEPRCITLFWNEDCSLSSGKRVTIAHQWDFYFPANYPPPESYRLCTPTEEMPLVENDNHGPIQSLRGFSQHRKICGCAKLPLYLDEQPPASSDQVCVRLHLEEDCSGLYDVIIVHPEKDLTYDTLPILWKTRALEPCKPTPDCKKRLAGTIIKIEVAASPTKSQLDAATEQLEMGSQTRFQNNGSAKLIQQYAVKRVVTESKRVEIAKSLSSVHHIQVSPSVTAEMEVDIQFAKPVIKTAVSGAYDWTRTETDETRKQRVLTTQKEFTIMKRIEIPPCTEYTVTSYVKILENMPIEYTVFTELKGTIGDRRMSAEELQAEFKNMQLVHVADNFTVIVKETASMTLSMGIESVMDGRGSKILGCQNHLTISTTTTVVPVPLVTSDATGNAFVRVFIAGVVILHYFLSSYGQVFQFFHL